MLPIAISLACLGMCAEFLGCAAMVSYRLRKCLPFPSLLISTGALIFFSGIMLALASG